MANETCPHCGEDRNEVDRWLFRCGTPIRVLDGSHEYSRSPECLRNQLAAVTAERDDLQQRLDAAAECVTQFRGAVWAYGSKCEQEELEKLTNLVTDDQPGA